MGQIARMLTGVKEINLSSRLFCPWRLHVYHKISAFFLVILSVLSFICYSFFFLWQVIQSKLQNVWCPGTSAYWNTICILARVWFVFLKNTEECVHLKWGQIARMLTVRREREIEQGITMRESRKLDRKWKKSIVPRPPPSYAATLAEQAKKWTLLLFSNLDALTFSF